MGCRGSSAEAVLCLLCSNLFGQCRSLAGFAATQRETVEFPGRAAVHGANAGFDVLDGDGLAILHFGLVRVERISCRRNDPVHCDKVESEYCYLLIF
jgi:hypothetical protein